MNKLRSAWPHSKRSRWDNPCTLDSLPALCPHLPVMCVGHRGRGGEGATRRRRRQQLMQQERVPLILGSASINKFVRWWFDLSKFIFTLDWTVRHRFLKHNYIYIYIYAREYVRVECTSQISFLEICL